MAMTAKANVTVVMPVFNEKVFIPIIIEKVIATGIPSELVIIDDFSTDGTREFLSDFSKNSVYKGCAIKVCFHERNMGKGAALRTGFSSATGDIVIVQDADLEYDPKDYRKLIEPILDGKADVVYGSRFSGECHRVLFFWHMLGNKTLTLCSNILSNLNLTDMETGYKAFRAEVLRNITLTSDRFGFEPEITAKVAKKRYRIYETAISYSGRTYDEGKKISWKDGVAAFWHIFKFNVLG